ncbi:hypothetical protein SAMN06266982_1074 [Propioniciclava tarda]|nr:hypothetical protein SAMN06266982_1074 [Propioniciclava tarda]
MLIGHTLPRGGSTYLSVLVARLRAGDVLSLAGRPYAVPSVTSIPKRSLPEGLYASEGVQRHLVTCDPASGYTRWSDGQLHANNNLVVTLDPA